MFVFNLDFRYVPIYIYILLASERSERDTIRGNKWKSEIYTYKYILIP